MTIAAGKNSKSAGRKSIGDFILSRERSARSLAIFMVAALVIALIYHGVLYLLGAGYPWDTFLFAPYDRFDDWFSSVISAATHDPYVHSKGSYFPFAYILLLVGNVAPYILSYSVFVAISAAIIGFGVYLFRRNIVAGNRLDLNQGLLPGDTLFLPLLLIAFLNYPALFGLDRGNVDLWVGGLCLIFVAELRKPVSWLGVVALSVAIAMKGYPMALLMLRLTRRQYGQVFGAAALAAGFTILALLLFHSSPQASWHVLQQHEREFWQISVVGSGSMFASSDPYNAVRGLAWIALHAYQQFFTHAQAQVNTGNAQHVDFHEHAKFLKSIAGNGGMMTGSRVMAANAYVGLTTLLAGISSLFVLFTPARAWRQLAVMTVATILYPHIAQDYKLILLLPVVFSILAQPEPGKAQAWIFWLTALLLVPKSYLFFYGIGITMIVNPILLVAVWGIAISDTRAWRDGIGGFKNRLAWFFFQRPDAWTEAE